uniref:Uncharacterized protein n=1 Tax=Lactuca sativa TaxID=4236 RepID=A0A9R1XRJ8_LACSA|nr:hypothetical protein LSAT_V11C100045050 [Lactuca sativa]
MISDPIIDMNTGFINSESKWPKSTTGTELNECISNDCIVRSWILNVISKEIVGAFILATTSKELGDEVEEHFGKSNGPLIYQLQ